MASVSVSGLRFGYFQVVSAQFGSVRWVGLCVVLVGFVAFRFGSCRFFSFPFAPFRSQRFWVGLVSVLVLIQYFEVLGFDAGLGFDRFRFGDLPLHDNS